MLTFRPIAYNPANYTAFKYVGTSSCTEGQICYLSASALGYNSCTLFNGVSPATIPLGVVTTATGLHVYDKSKYFVIFREDPDLDSTAGTIAKNEWCTAFPLIPGAEFEVHKNVIERGVATVWSSIGQNACLGSNGKWTPINKDNATGLVLAECIGTFNSTWIRLRVK